jgi:hypothetical protein
VPGRRRQAPPAVPRRRVHRQPDGAAGPLHRRRTRPRRGPVHVAHLRRAGEKGAARHLRPHQGGARPSQGARVVLGNADLAARNAAAARDRASALRPVLAELAGQSLRSIAAELNARRIPAARGGQWSVVSICRPGSQRWPDGPRDCQRASGPNAGQVEPS